MVTFSEPSVRFQSVKSNTFNVWAFATSILQSGMVFKGNSVCELPSYKRSIWSGCKLNVLINITPLYATENDQCPWPFGSYSKHLNPTSDFGWYIRFQKSKSWNLRIPLQNSLFFSSLISTCLSVLICLWDLRETWKNDPVGWLMRK